MRVTGPLCVDCGTITHYSPWTWHSQGCIQGFLSLLLFRFKANFNCRTPPPPNSRKKSAFAFTDDVICEQPPRGENIGGDIITHICQTANVFADVNAHFHVAPIWNWPYPLKGMLIYQNPKVPHRTRYYEYMGEMGLTNFHYKHSIFF